MPLIQAAQLLTLHAGHLAQLISVFALQLIHTGLMSALQLVYGALEILLSDLTFAENLIFEGGDLLLVFANDLIQALRMLHLLFAHSVLHGPNRNLFFAFDK